MTLEDHPGDIIRKARQATNVSREALAQAGGITVSQLEDLEKTGEVPPGAKLTDLAAQVGLNGPKLERIANGWLPENVDPSLWREVRQIKTTRRMEVN